MTIRMGPCKRWALFLCTYLVAYSNGLESDEVIKLLSPHNQATLVATSLMVLIQLPVPGYQLIGNSWMLCIRTDITGQEDSFCMNDYSATGFDSTNNTIMLFEPAVHDGTFFLEATLKPQHGSTLSDTPIYSVISHFSVTLPLSGPADAAVNSLADFTYLQDNSFDMIRMRMREHQPDVLLLADTNESHSGYLEKKYVIPECAGSLLSSHTEHNDGSTVALAPQEFSDITSIEARYFEKDAASAKISILVNHPPSQPDAKLREMLHRDSVGALCRQLESTTAGPLPDMYIVSDTDEIIHRKAIGAIKASTLLQQGDQKGRDTIVFMLLDFHLYKFNWKFPNQQWGLHAQEGAFVAPASLVRRFTTSASMVNDNNNADNTADITATGVRRLLRPVNRQLLLQLASEYNIVYWDHAGWHLSQFYSPAEMARAKKMAFSDQEESFMSKMWTEDNCALMQEYGVPHYMLEGRKQGITYMLEGRNPLVYQPIPSLPTTHTADEAAAPALSVMERTATVSSVMDNTDAIDAWELKHNLTLPLALYEDQALLHRHVHRTYDSQGPDLQSRRTAAEYLVEQYSAALPPSQAGGQVIYSAPAGAGTFVQFRCYSHSTSASTSTVRADGSTSEDAPISLEQGYGHKQEQDQLKQDFYRSEVIDKLFCEDKARCPYSKSDEAIAFAIQWVNSQCRDTNVGTVSIQVLSSN